MRLLSIVGLLGACTNQPREDYDDFRERSAAERNVDASLGEAGASLQDITGRWLMHALLPGGIDLGLIVEFEPQNEVPEGEIPTTYTARIWLWRQDIPPVACDAATVCANGTTCNAFGTCERPPLVTTTSVVDAEGNFEVVADPLFLDRETLNTEEPVQARVVIAGRSTGPDNWCGSATGAAISPLSLNLAGTTLSSFRHRPQDWVCRTPEGGADCTPEQQADTANYAWVYEELPFRCPAGAGGDMGVPPDMGVIPDGGPRRPEAPDLSGVASAARDLTGNYVFSGKVNGAIPLQLWLSVIYTGGPNGANLDGALRSVTAEPGSEALAVFSTTVDPDGYFQVWLPGLDIATDLATVNADILLAAATVEGGFCGIAAGQVNQPPLGALNENTTFFAAPWDPNTEVPEGLATACPE